MTVERNGCHGQAKRRHVVTTEANVRPTRRVTELLVFCMGIPLLFGALGCHGNAFYTIASLDMKRVSASENLTLNINASECYHWINEFGELCFAFRMTDSSILGKQFSRNSIASFVLSDPPVATGKNYRATRRTARFINHAGYGHTRSASLGGIVGVWNYDKPTIRGRFRLTTIHQSYSVLTGWAGKTHFLYVGEFKSVLNQAAGEAILAETEKDGMARKRPIGKARRIQGPFQSIRKKNKK